MKKLFNKQLQTKLSSRLKNINLIKSSVRLFGDHHHEITGEVDLKRVYCPQPENLGGRFISLSGLKADQVSTSKVQEGAYKALYKKNPLAWDNYHKLANVENEKNPYFHTEPYGYDLGDDVKIYNLAIRPLSKTILSFDARISSFIYIHSF